MRRLRYTPCLLFLAILGSTANGQDETRTAPDQRYGIAFASLAPLNTDIFVAGSDGSDPKPLLPHPDLDSDASFSADGRWIVFTSMRNGSADIYRVHTDGSGLERLTHDPAFDDQGALSPDGRSLAFVSSRSGQADIWTLELSTGITHNVSSHPAGDFRPSWSPDGKWLAFSSDRASKKPIFGKRRSQRLVSRRGVDRVHERAWRVQRRGGAPPVQSAAIRRSICHARRRIGRTDTDRRSVRGWDAELVHNSALTMKRAAQPPAQNEYLIPSRTSRRF
jgi:WD40 repeat protein